MNRVHEWALPDADSYFAPHLTARGFEIEKLDAALEYVTNWGAAVDGGAHVGTWTAALAKRFETVLAFEPAADTFECLVRNTADDDNVVQLRMALGQRAGRAAIGDDELRPGNTGARFIRAGDEIDVEALDEFRIDDLGFLKLDLEGGEYFALLGGERTIRACKPVVVIEDKDFGARFGVKAGAALELLHRWGAREVGRIRADHIFVWE